MSLKFSLKLKTTPVILTGPDGRDQQWEIREMVASQRDTYMDSLSGRVELNTDGNIQRITKVAGMHTDLLTRSLFLNGVPVTDKQLADWPSSTVTELFREAQKLNGLAKTAEESQAEAKNA